MNKTTTLRKSRATPAATRGLNAHAPIITGMVIAAAGAYVLGTAALLLWLSGNWRWVEGWIFGVCWVSLVVAVFLQLWFKDPALLAERMRMPGSGGESRTDS